MSNLKGGNTLKIQGFVNIELVDSKTGKMKQKFKYNTVTDIGKMVFLTSGPGLQLMQPTQIDRGMLYMESPFTQESNAGGYMEIDVLDKAMHMYLVNTTENPTAESRFLPIYQPNGTIDNAKLVGFAGLRRSPSSVKEGVIDRMHDDYMLDQFAQVQRWKFDNTQGNGTFNKICIGAGVYNTPGNGFALSKGLNPADTPTFGGIGALSSAYLRPGVTGLTGATEILVSTAAQANPPVSNAVYDFATGKLTALASGDARYGVPLGVYYAQQIFYGGFLYFLDYSGYVKKYDPVAKTTVQLQQSSGVLWANGKFLYMCSNSNVIPCYDMDLASWGTSLNLNTQTFTTTNFKTTLASEALQSCYMGKMLNGNYVIIPNSQSYGPKYNIEFTDINNIEGSIVGYRPGIHSASEYLIGAKNVNIWAGVVHDFKWTNVQGFSSTDYTRAANGLKFSENWFGNMISFVNLTSPFTKTELDVLYISYGYRIA